MNNYHLYEEIGHGKHSTVYKGRRRGTIQYVAIKSVDKSKRARVLTEVAISQDLLPNENVCEFHNWYETRNHLWIVAELCAGGDLARVLKQDERIVPELQVKKFAAEIVNGLVHLHAAGIVFADLKPSNVLFTESGKVKLAGFSVSQRLAELESALTEGKQVPRRGSPFYMAPELFVEDGCHSFASDIWALGVVLFEMYNGKTPFGSSASFAELQRAVTAAAVTTPELAQGASEEMRHLIARMLAKDPSDRIGWKEIVTHPWWSGIEVATSWLPIVESRVSVNESNFRTNFLNKISTHSSGLRRRNSSFDVGKESGDSSTPRSSSLSRQRPSTRE